MEKNIDCFPFLEDFPETGCASGYSCVNIPTIHCHDVSAILDMLKSLFVQYSTHMIVFTKSGGYSPNEYFDFGTVWGCFNPLIEYNGPHSIILNHLNMSSIPIHSCKYN